MTDKRIEEWNVIIHICTTQFMIASRYLEIISFNIFFHSSAFLTMVSHTLLKSIRATLTVVKNYKKRQRQQLETNHSEYT